MNLSTVALRSVTASLDAELCIAVNLRVVEVSRSSNVRGDRIAREVVDPRVTRGEQAGRVLGEDSHTSVFVPDRWPFAEVAAALVDPVAVLVRRRSASQVSRRERPVGDDGELLLASQVVANVAVADFARSRMVRDP